MGGALLAGWREHGLAPSVVVDPARPASPGPEITVVAEAAEIPAGFAPAAVVFAVKPQNAAAVLPLYVRHAGSAVFLSIMAGRTVAGIRAVLGERAAVVRAIPNTPAAVHQGVTVAFAGPGVSAPQHALCDTLLQAVGITTPHIEAHNVSAWAQYTVRVPNRDAVQAALREAGIPTAVHYPIPLNQQPAVADADAQLPLGDAAAREVLSLPMHPYLPEEHAQKIAQALEGAVR